jgi:hypothetical protein
MSAFALISMMTEDGVVREERVSTTETTCALHSRLLIAVSDAVFALTQLVKLELGANRLVSLSPAVGRLTSLMNLSLRGNRLSSLPKEIGQLKSLRTLDVRPFIPRQCACVISSLLTTFLNHRRWATTE